MTSFSRLAAGVARSERLIAFVACLSVWMWSSSALAQLFSPGELAAAHSAIDGDENCGQCHSAGRRVDNALCIQCHEDVGKTVQQKTGLHGLQFADQDCGHCHVDHRGASQALIRWDPEQFEHEQSGWELEGAHRSVQCRQCHDEKNTRGNPTYLGLQTRCGSCHEDPHAKALGSDCQSCHAQDQWTVRDRAKFDHDLTVYPLRGKHQNVECTKCHDGANLLVPVPFEDCGDCHRDPHEGQFKSECSSCHVEDSWQTLDMPRSAHPGLSLAAGHRKVACQTCHDQGNLKPPSAGSECASCHKPIHEASFGNDCAQCHASIRFTGLPRRIGLRSHSKTAFALEGRHEQVPCAECHDPELPADARFRQLKFSQCMDCHQDVHRGQLTDRQGGECAACHTVQGFVPTTFGPVQHAQLSLPLTGGHEAAPCSSCHSGQTPRLDWQPRGATCAECHDNPHGNQFQAEMAAGGCASCHSATAWNVLSIAHETWPLTGAHASARCEQCHAGASSTPNLATVDPVQYRGAPRQCEGCHEDEHRGQFRLEEPTKGCEVCHDTATFKVSSFDHSVEAQYALEGKHAEAKCSACHQRQQLANGASAVLWRLGYRDCRDCHADPHKDPLLAEE